MRNLLRTAEDYELFLYTLTEQFPSMRNDEKLYWVIAEVEALTQDVES